MSKALRLSEKWFRFGLWLVAVVRRRSSASTTTCVAESKPKVIAVAFRSLSIVLGTPITGTPSSKNCSAVVSEPSPPTQIRASMPRLRRVDLACRISSSGTFATSPQPCLEEKWP